MTFRVDLPVTDAPEALFESGVPILGICYGQQVMTHQLGGEVRPGHETGEGGEFGAQFWRGRWWIARERD